MPSLKILLIKKPKTTWAFLFSVIFTSFIFCQNAMAQAGGPTANSADNTDASRSLFHNFDLEMMKQQDWDPFVQRLTDRPSLEFTLQGTLLTLLASTSDTSFKNQWGQHQLMSQSTSNLGNFLGTGIPGLLIAAGHSYWAPEKAPSLWRSFIYTGLVTGAMKVGFGKKRPASDDRQSFPSGHTSTAFGTATSLTLLYGSKAGWVAYPLAVLTGLSRISDDAHWWSDVIAGAYVGVIIARAATYSEKDIYRKEAEPKFMWLPTFEKIQIQSKQDQAEGRYGFIGLYQF